MRSKQKFAWIALMGMMVISFQNCGKPFHAASNQTDASSSAQCTAKRRAEAASFKLSAAELKCGDFNAYACERRIFSPDAADITESIKECVGTGNACVDVDIRQFNTAGARGKSFTDPASFLPGGDYNHEEINCYHRMVVRGTSLFESSADSLAEALARAMAACEQAVGS